LSDVRDWYDYTYEIVWCKRAPMVWIYTGEILAIAKGPQGMVIPNRGKPMAMQDIRARVKLCKGM
jgi:hypothetical protein